MSVDNYGEDAPERAAIAAAYELSHKGNMVIVVNYHHKIIWADEELYLRTELRPEDLINKDLNVLLEPHISHHLENVRNYLDSPESVSRKMDIGRVVKLRTFREDFLIKVRVILSSFLFKASNGFEEKIWKFGIAQLCPENDQAIQTVVKLEETLEDGVITTELKTSTVQLQNYIKISNAVKENIASVTTTLIVAFFVILLLGLYNMAKEPYFLFKKNEKSQEESQPKNPQGVRVWEEEKH